MFSFKIQNCFPTNRDAHLSESNFQTHSSMRKKKQDIPFISSTSKNKWLAISRRMIFSYARRRNEAMRWHRRLTTTQQMRNQASDIAGYLLFDVLDIFSIQLSLEMPWTANKFVWMIYRMENTVLSVFIITKFRGNFIVWRKKIHIFV